MRQLNTALIARRRIAVERKVPAMPDHRLAVLKGANAQLWALQIGKNGDGPVELFLHRADCLDRGGVIGMIAMAHIDAECVCACLEQLFQHLRRAACGAKGCKDLDLTAAGGKVRHDNGL